MKAFLQRAKISGPLVGTVMAVALAALAFVVTGLVLSYGAKVNADVGAQFTVNSTAYTTNNNVTSGLMTFGQNMPTVASVIVAVVIISLLFIGFGSLITRGSGGSP